MRAPYMNAASLHAFVRTGVLLPGGYVAVACGVGAS